MSADLREADYRRAARSCDVVMKGGITSGVVYPHAVCELARTYRFKNVGGTSAGAIAAAATAAAEYGRAGGGFNELAKLPDWLGAGTNLRDLFQPQPRTRRLYAVLLAKLDGGWKAAIGTALREHPLAALAGLAPGVALIAVALLAAVAGGSAALIVAAGLVSVLVGLPVALLGCAAAVAGRIGLEGNREIADNGFGLCSGGPEEGLATEPLTVWLAAKLDGYAGLTEGTPLTFGHLWAGPDGDRAHPPTDPDERELQLAMMTTNLTNRRAHQLPWAGRDWFFSPAEFRQLFPEDVVGWMEDHSRDKAVSDCLKGQDRESRVRLALARDKGLLALPEPADIPVVVATRMSLSFPVLLSAVPLWKIDMTREDNGALPEWQQWARQQPQGWDPLAGETAEWPAAGQPPRKPTIEPCWFSDGGISSNFPVHFFDRLVPRWPTFAINLRPFPWGRAANEADQAKNTWMVESNADGWNEWWYRFPERQSVARKDRRLVEFLSSVIRTMQNRVDEAQMRVPGYRDRVAHVSMSDDEGGMNLTMPEPRIRALTARGRAAADRLVDAYVPPDRDGQKITWDNHRWVRFRSALAALEEMHARFGSGYSKPPAAGESSYAWLLERGEGEPPDGYPVGVSQRELARIEVEKILAAVSAATARAPTERLADGAPRPVPEGRIVPRD